MCIIALRTRPGVKTIELRLVSSETKRVINNWTAIVIYCKRVIKDSAQEFSLVAKVSNYVACIVPERTYSRLATEFVVSISVKLVNVR
jgi:hypothetical protein